MISLSRRQALALQRSRKTINIWQGSVRSGKTHASLWAFIRVMADRARTGDTDGVILVVAHSTNTAWRNLFQPILTKPDFAAVAPHLKYRANAPSGTLFGVPFSVVGAHDKSSWLAIQGMTVRFCLGDEMTAWPESFWTMLLSRLSMKDSWFLGTLNPGTSSHYLKKLIDSGDPDVHVETLLIEENPTLGADYIARTKRLYTGLFYKRMILCMWVAAEGAVYQFWDPDTMCRDYDPQDGSVSLVEVLSVGVDYGTNHPTAGYAVGLMEDTTSRERFLMVLSEWSPNLETGTHQRLTDAQLADSFQKWLTTLPAQPRFIYCDPAAASFREELHNRGVRTSKASNAVVDGIRTVDSALTAGLLFIDKGCAQLIEEIPGYRWDSKAADKGKDAPIKEKDDHCDALRYAVYSCRHVWKRHVKHTIAFD